MNAKDVRITVVKNLFHEDLADAYTEGPAWTPCTLLTEGQEFVSEGGIHMPSGFCSWAWGDVHKYTMALARGANFVGVKPGVFVTCCTDGFRPVVFKLERIEN